MLEERRLASQRMFNVLNAFDPFFKEYLDNNSWTEADWIIFNNKDMIRDGYNIDSTTNGVVYTPERVRNSKEVLMQGKTWSAKWYQPKEIATPFLSASTKRAGYWGLPRFSKGETIDTMAPQPMSPGEGAYKGKTCIGNVILTGASTLIASATVASAFLLF